MADERPKRQRRARSATEFSGLGLLHKEEVELRKALQASLKEVRTVYQRKDGKPSESENVGSKISKNVQDKPPESFDTKSVCTGTNTRFRLKSSARKRFEKSSKQCRDSLMKKHFEDGICDGTGQVMITAVKRKNDGGMTSCSVKKRKKMNSEELGKVSTQNSDNKVLTKLEKRKIALISPDKQNTRRNVKKSSEEGKGKYVAKMVLQSPLNTLKAVKSLWKKELTILPKSKLTLKESQSHRKVNCSQKSKVVQSLNAKFGANISRNEKQLLSERRKGNEIQIGMKCDSEKTMNKADWQKSDVEKSEQECSSSEDSTKQDSVCQSKLVSSLMQGRFKKRLQHKFKDRKLVNPLGEIYIPANVAKTEDFLTFLCLRGNSSLPKSFDIFSNPDPFVTQPADQLPFSAFPMQSSFTYSPPSSRAPTPSESSVASPMSSNDGWTVNEV